MKNSILALVGAGIGGVVGYYAYFWAFHQGFYALALPGGLLGLGAGWKRNRSIAVPIVCGLAALALGLVAEWQSDRFVVPFAEFLGKLASRPPLTLVMVAVGAGVGFWIPFRSTDRPVTASR